MDAKYQDAHDHQTQPDNEGDDLMLAMNKPIILGRKSLIELANLSLNIAEDMSS